MTPRSPANARPSAWSVALSGSLQDKLALARDPTASSEDLSAIAPTYHDVGPDLGLIAAVLAHPAVPDGVVSRYVRAPSPVIRRSVAAHPRCPWTALEVLALDPDATVAATAAARLVGDDPGSSVHGPVAVSD
jgi:hypothetical protein